MDSKSGNTINAAEIRNRVFSHMLATRSWKYRAFLRYLRLFKYLAFAPTRGKFLESYYVLMRYLDDIVDGDAPLPENYQNSVQYISEKIQFARNPSNPVDETDHLLKYCYDLSEEFDEDFRSETEDILNSLLFDARRKGKQIIFPEAELQRHFHLMDIRGTIRATLKVFKDDPDKYKLLEPLGTACRFQYDIEDIEDDLSTGFINISREECEEYQISMDDIQNPSSPKIKSWLRRHAKEGLNLLQEHREIMPEGNFSFFEKCTFLIVYETPARKTFQKTLSEIKI